MAYSIDRLSNISDASLQRVTNRGEYLPTEPVKNQSIGFMLGSIRDYSFGKSNPALRPVVPRGC